MKLLPTLIAVPFLLAVHSQPVHAATISVTHEPDGNITIIADDWSGGVEQAAIDISYSPYCGAPRPNIVGKTYSEDMLRSSTPGKMSLVLDMDDGDPPVGVILEFNVKPENRPCVVDAVQAKYIYGNGNVEFPEVKITAPALKVKKQGLLPGKTVPSQGKTPGIPAAAPVTSRDGTAGTGKVSVPSTPASAETRAKKEGVAGTAVDHYEYISCPDIIQRLADYRGDRSLGYFISLLADANPCVIKQTPEVAISDGSGKVVVTLETRSCRGNAPNVAVEGGRLLSLRPEGDNTLSVELLPNRGEHAVSLFYLTDGVLKRIPLVVAPPLALYLSGLSTGDKLSPMLDFVVMANYYVSRNDKGAKTTK